ncbi:MULTISPECIES: hypothetical protein [Streptomyces]|uniref:Uncharacterized protein n=1 Tax=Streptomyces venezuelae TaxID=54571 RepID=A0A5P2B127_STRVZ|nr:hypothetical protein [Streptomyces venezuelae]QES23737.1 hypothetical protein DEJ46_35260 [Streptomyces venezuelae]
MPRHSPAHSSPLATAVAVTSATIALVATLLAGLGEPPSGERPPPERPGSAGAVTADDRLLHDAEQRLLRDCMRRHGFTYEVFPLDEDSGATAFVYVLDDADRARRHGYGSELRRQRDARAASDPNRAYFAALPTDRKAAALAAANGTSPDGLTVTLPGGGSVRRSDRGCVAESQKGLYGDLGAWFRASTRVDALVQIRRSRVVADPGYRGRLGAWRECMRRAGHAFAAPADARAAALSPERPLGKEREVALALAEVRCGGESGLAGTARDLDEHHGRLLAGEYRADVETRDRLRAAALPRAHRILDADERA